jgi:hypothetical protein
MSEGGRLSGANFESLIDRQIREAQERGAFDDLPGAGKPIPNLEAPHDELWWIKDKLRRENASYTPPTLLLRKEAEDIHEAAAEERSETAVRALVADLNARIVDAIRRPMSGPALNLGPVDVERVIRQWHRRRRE